MQPDRTPLKVVFKVEHPQGLHPDATIVLCGSTKQLCWQALRGRKLYRTKDGGYWQTDAIDFFPEEFSNLEYKYAVTRGAQESWPQTPNRRLSLDEVRKRGGKIFDGNPYSNMRPPQDEAPADADGDRHDRALSTVDALNQHLNQTLKDLLDGLHRAELRLEHLELRESPFASSTQPDLPEWFTTYIDSRADAVLRGALGGPAGAAHRAAVVHEPPASTGGWLSNLFGSSYVLKDDYQRRAKMMQERINELELKVNQDVIDMEQRLQHVLADKAQRDTVSKLSQSVDRLDRCRENDRDLVVGSRDELQKLRNDISRLDQNRENDRDLVMSTRKKLNALDEQTRELAEQLARLGAAPAAGGTGEAPEAAVEADPPGAALADDPVASSPAAAVPAVAAEPVPSAAVGLNGEEGWRPSRSVDDWVAVAPGNDAAAPRKRGPEGPPPGPEPASRAVSDHLRRRSPARLARQPAPPPPPAFSVGSLSAAGGVDLGSEFLSFPHPEDPAVRKETIAIEKELVRAKARMMPLDDRRKLLKSIFLRVHPDKRPEPEKAVAEQVMDWFKKWQDTNKDTWFFVD